MRSYNHSYVLSVFGIDTYSVNIISGQLLNTALFQVCHISIIMYESAEGTDTSLL